MLRLIASGLSTAILPIVFIVDLFPVYRAVCRWLLLFSLLCLLSVPSFACLVFIVSPLLLPFAPLLIKLDK